MSDRDKPKKRKRRKHITYLPLIGIDARFMQYARPYIGLLGVTFGLIVLVAIFDILAPWPIKYIVDNVIGAVMDGHVEPAIGHVKRQRGAHRCAPGGRRRSELLCRELARRLPVGPACGRPVAHGASDMLRARPAVGRAHRARHP